MSCNPVLEKALFRISESLFPEGCQVMETSTDRVRFKFESGGMKEYTLIRDDFDDSCVMQYYDNDVIYMIRVEMDRMLVIAWRVAGRLAIARQWEAKEAVEAFALHLERLLD